MHLIIEAIDIPTCWNDQTQTEIVNITKSAYGI